MNIEIKPVNQPLRFGVKEEMGMAIRVATPITVKNGGTIRSASGGVNEKGTWGKLDDWWDYSGVVGGKRVGVRISRGIDTPPVWSHSRDYGVLVANPFPVEIPENRDLVTEVAVDDRLHLNFEIQVNEEP